MCYGDFFVWVFFNKHIEMHKCFTVAAVRDILHPNVSAITDSNLPAPASTPSPSWSLMIKPQPPGTWPCLYRADMQQVWIFELALRGRSPCLLLRALSWNLHDHSFTLITKECIYSSIWPRPHSSAISPLHWLYFSHPATSVTRSLSLCRLLSSVQRLSHHSLDWCCW